jgi:DNA-binding NarL/FixJ family response regulator
MPMRGESDIFVRRLMPEERPTRDERRVMRLLADGLTDENAAEKLGWSRRTLDRRLRSSMEKLGAQSRLQAGVLLVRSGWLDETDPL